MKNYIYWFLLKMRSLRGKELNEIENVKSAQDLSRFAGKYLKMLLIHAYNHVKYFNKIFNEIGIIKKGEIALKQI